MYICKNLYTIQTSNKAVIISQITITNHKYYAFKVYLLLIYRGF